jgi:hypothetical protein
MPENRCSSFHLKLHTSWKKIQDFKVRRLLLSYCEASQHVRKIWVEDMEFFRCCGKGESFGEAITRFRASGLKMKLACSAAVMGAVGWVQDADSGRHDV